MGAKPTVSPRIGAAPTVSQSCERCAPSDIKYLFAFDCRKNYDPTRIYSPDPPCICHTKFPYCPSIREAAKLLRPDLVYDDPCELEPLHAAAPPHAAHTELGTTHFRAVPAGPVRTPFDPNGADTGHGIGTLPCGLRIYRSSRPNPAPGIIYVMLYDPQSDRWCAAHAPKALVSTPCRMDDYGKVYPM